jgi:hypothetical protein
MSKNKILLIVIVIICISLFFIFSDKILMPIIETDEQKAIKKAKQDYDNCIKQSQGSGFSNCGDDPTMTFEAKLKRCTDRGGTLNIFGVCSKVQFGEYGFGLGDGSWTEGLDPTGGKGIANSFQIAIDDAKKKFPSKITESQYNLLSDKDKVSYSLAYSGADWKPIFANTIQSIGMKNNHPSIKFDKTKVVNVQVSKSNLGLGAEIFETNPKNTIQSDYTFFEWIIIKLKNIF